MPFTKRTFGHAINALTQEVPPKKEVLDFDASVFAPAPKVTRT